MASVEILQAEAGDGDGRATALDRLATDLEREAAILAGRLDGAARAFTDSVWRGPAATRAREALLVKQGRLRSAADELRRVATLLRRRAGDARAQSADLRRQASRLAADQARAPAGSVPS